MLSIGVIVIALAIFSFLLVPGWRGSPLGVFILILALIAGISAVVVDIRNLLREYRSLPAAGHDDKDSPSR